MSWWRRWFGRGCPSEERIRAAVRSDYERERTREIGRHALGCPRCAAVWRDAWDRSHDARATNLAAPRRRRPGDDVSG